MRGVSLHTVCIQLDGGGVCLPKEVGALLNSARHHKVFYKSHCVSNTLSSTAALATVKATEGGLLKFNSLNAFGAILKLSSQLIGSTAFMTLSLLVSPFAASEWKCVRGQGGGIHTWTHTEDLVKVSTDAHLLVELGRLGQVGAGFKVRHREDICSTFTGRWKWRETTFRHEIIADIVSDKYTKFRDHFGGNWGFSLHKLRHTYITCSLDVSVGTLNTQLILIVLLFLKIRIFLWQLQADRNCATGCEKVDADKSQEKLFFHMHLIKKQIQASKLYKLW